MVVTSEVAGAHTPIHAALAILEAPQAFVLEARPALVGIGASGKWQFLGGHADRVGGVLEDPEATIRRELAEETEGLEVESMQFTPVWSGLWRDARPDGSLRIYQTGLLHAYVASHDFAGRMLPYPTRITTVGKNLAEVNAAQGQLAPFAFWALTKFLRGERWD